MQIDSLQLKNFGSIKEANIDFEKGFNLISGTIGQGKSTLFEAIDYTIRKNSRPFINMIKRGETELSLSMGFRHNTKNFKVDDSLSLKKKTVEHLKKLSINEETFESLGEVETLLSKYFDPSLCGAALLTKQGETELIEARASERKEILQRIYDLEFKDEILYLDSAKKDLEVKLKDVENSILILKNQEYKIHELLEEKLSKEEVDSLEEAVKDKESIVNDIKSKVNSQLELMSKIESLEKDLSSIILSINKQQKSKEDAIKIIEDLKLNIEKPQESVDETLLNSLIDELSNLPSIVRQVVIENNLLTINNEVKSIEKSLTLKEEKYLSMIENTVCPTCKRAFEFSKEEIDLLSIEVVKLKTSLEDILEIKSIEEKKIQDYENKVKENQEIKNKRTILETKIESEKKSIEQNKKIFENKLIALKEKLEIYEKNLLEAENSLQDLEVKKESTSNSIAFEKNSVQDISELKSKMNALLEEIKSNLETITEAKSILDKNDSFLKINNETLNRKEENEKKIKQQEISRDLLLKDISLNSSSISILKKDFPNYVISKMISSLEEGINDFVLRVYNGKYKVYMEDTKTGIEMVYDDCKAPIKEASGGEKQIFNIATKIAYAKIANLKVLLLDESFSMLNDELAVKCFEALAGMIEDGIFNQIFVITHQEEVKDFLVQSYSAKVFEVENGEVNKIA